MFTFMKNKNDNMQFPISGNFSAKWSKPEQKYPSSPNTGALTSCHHLKAARAPTCK